MALEDSNVPEYWRSAAIVPLYKGKVERTECKNHRGTSLLRLVGKMYAAILVYRVRRVTGSLTDDGQGGFRAGRGCVDQILHTREREFDQYFDTFQFFPLINVLAS